MTVTEEQSDQFWQYVQGVFAEQGVVPGPEATPAHFERYQGVLPDLLLRVWREYGFCGFDRGRIWLCDPTEWQPAADAWVGSLDLQMGADTFHPYLRTAFGELELWGERTGPSLDIVTLTGQVFPIDMSGEVGDDLGREIAMMTALTNIGPDKYRFYDEGERELFEPCLGKLGQLAPDEMYTFVPVPALGGALTLATAAIEKAVAHELLLAHLEGGEVRGDIGATEKSRADQVDDWISGDE